MPKLKLGPTYDYLGLRTTSIQHNSADRYCAHLLRAVSQQPLGPGPQARAGRRQVIHDHQRAAGDPPGPACTMPRRPAADRERGADIRMPGVSIQLELRPRRSTATDCRPDWERGAAEGVRKIPGLIEAAAPLTPGMERHGYQRVGAAEDLVVRGTQQGSD